MNGTSAEGVEHDFEFGTTVIPPLAQLRSWLRGLLRDVTDEACLDVELAATELLTNAYEHAAGPFELRLLRPRGRPMVRLEVDDACPHLLPQPRGDAPTDHRGRGLMMIKAVSRAWGVRLNSDRKTIWAEISVIQGD